MKLLVGLLAFFFLKVAYSVPGPFPRADLPYAVDSSVLPLRVSYADRSNKTLAQAALSQVEQTWRQFLDAGFSPPMIDPRVGYYQVFVEKNSDPAWAWAESYPVPKASSANGCYSDLVLNSRYNPYDLTVVAHEFTHVAHLAVDCAEPVFEEGVATYVQTVIAPSRWRILVSDAVSFQRNPWRGLDDVNPSPFAYGTGLFILYLAETYAASNPLGFVKDVWAADANQSSGLSHDMYQAVGEALRMHDGAATFESAFLDFSESRFFVGANDDGRHLKQASRLAGDEVSLAGHFFAKDLPIRAWTPAADRRPVPFGSNQLLLELPPAERALRIHFSGDSSVRWGARAVLFGRPPTKSLTLPIDASASATLDLGSAGYEKLLLVVANLGTGTYLPCQDGQGPEHPGANSPCRWTKAPYTVDILSRRSESK